MNWIKQKFQQNVNTTYWVDTQNDEYQNLHSGVWHGICMKSPQCLDFDLDFDFDFDFDMSLKN